MSMRIPPLLEPYLSPSSSNPSSLFLLTSVLGASANWLILRYLYSHLKTSQMPSVRRQTNAENAAGEVEDEIYGVVLVSFLRDGTFWREGAGKMGLDLEGMARLGRYVFVDGLTELIPISATQGDDGKSSSRRDTAATVAPALTQPSQHRVIRGVTVDAIRKEVHLALDSVQAARKILVVDGMDAVVAISGGAVTSLDVQNMVLQLREKVHSTIFTAAADNPLLHAQNTSLEKEHANLVLSMAHSADSILGLRMLDTGMARDVSGVVRITQGEGDEGREFLYYVGGDGGVSVFERGA